MARAQATVTTDHDEIRRWAEERGATPACVVGTGGEGDIGMLRLDFPGYSGADSLQHITWGEWFQKFDDRGLALLHQDRTASGEDSNFNKLISRETAEARAEGSSKIRRSARARRSSGGTSARRTASKTSKGRSATRDARSRSTASTRSSSKTRRGASGGRTGKKRAATKTAGTRQRSTASATRSSSRSSGRKSRSASAKSGQIRLGPNERVLIDHDEIRRWAEERGAKPARVKGTPRSADDVGIIRLDFPGYTGEETLQHISWDEWFKEFDKKNLALIVQDRTARGQKSNFNKIVARETVEQRLRGESHASRRHPERTSRSTSKTASSKATAKSTRGSTRAKRTESVRGRTTSRRRAA